MRKHAIYGLVLLAGIAVTSEADARGRAILDAGKWAGKTILGGFLYDSVRPDDAEAAPAYREEFAPPAYGPAPSPQPMTNVCVVPGLGSCALPYPIPYGTPCSCY